MLIINVIQKKFENGIKAFIQNAAADLHFYKNLAYFRKPNIKRLILKIFI